MTLFGGSAGTAFLTFCAGEGCDFLLGGGDRNIRCKIGLLAGHHLDFSMVTNVNGHQTNILKWPILIDDLIPPTKRSLLGVTITPKARHQIDVTI